jgi:hypothetical protein
MLRSSSSRSDADREPPSTTSLAQHSAASPDWGTPLAMRELAMAGLRPAASATFGRAIDIDYASSAYWHAQWPREQVSTVFLDGSPGRDVLVDADRARAIARLRLQHDARGVTAFLNPPGLDGGRMIQRCWEIFERDHRDGVIGSGCWIGFSLEQISHLQNTSALRHPLSTSGSDNVQSILTIIPSRRGRYLVHPQRALAIIAKKLKRPRPLSEAKALRRDAREIRARLRAGDATPIVGDAPPHASYVTFLLHRMPTIRRRQVEAICAYLNRTDTASKLFEHHAIVGTGAP